MDLYSGMPYWIIKNPLYAYDNPLKKDTKTEILIIGSGITGALIAHELCEAGFECCVIDKRPPSTGSSIASTALLQYEIDIPLFKMIEQIGEYNAVTAYKACLHAISDIASVLKKTGVEGDFKQVPSLFFASNKKGGDLIKKEFVCRKKYALPVQQLDGDAIRKRYQFDCPGALWNDNAAQIDTYKTATGLLKYHIKKNQLQLFTHATVTEWDESSSGYLVKFQNGNKIKCKYLIVAAGFEAGFFLPEKVMQLTSTYALISEPIDPELIWEKHSLIWETREPYLYIRTDGRNRIIVGGEDEEFCDPEKRDALLRKKTATLEKKFKKLFPHIPLKTEMAWCGTFSNTADGLPFIGSWPGKERMIFALGYGGNGITFSMIAAQIIKNRLKGIEDKRQEVFGFERIKK